MAYNPTSNRQGAIQVVAYTSAAATIANAFGTQTYQVRLAASSNCQYVVSEAASVTTATSLNASLLPPNWVETINVSPGQKISVVRAATDGLITGTSGTLNVTEVI